jgi:hypothetical protein
LQDMASADFAIDPTDPHFARLKHSKRIIEHVRERRKVAAEKNLEVAQGECVRRSEGKGALGEVKALVGSLKRKHKANGVATSGKRQSVRT